MSEIRIIVDIGGSASSLKDVINDLEKLRDVSEEIRAKKGKLIEAKGSEDIAKLTAEIESLRAKFERLTAEKVKAKQGASDLDKAILKLNKAQSDEGKELAKVNQQIKETNQLNKIQGGILGDLLKKRKQLQESLVSAKTTAEVKKINQELFRTNLEIGKVKADGTKAFNSWGNALSSFQFKFNALGALMGNMAATGLLGLAGTVKDFGVELLKGGVEWAKSVGLFGESIRAAKENSANLAGELQKVEDRLDAISKGADVQFSAAFDTVIQTIDLKLEKTRQTLDEFRPKLKGLSPEELADYKATLKKLTDEIDQLETERAVAIEAQYRDTQKRLTETAKKENIERVQDRIAALGIEIAKAKEAQADQEITVRQRDSRIADFKKQITDLEEISSQKQVERQVKANAARVENEKKTTKEIVSGKIKQGSITLTDPFGQPIKGPSQSLAEFEKDEQAKIDAQIADNKEKQDINDQFIAYELDALDGSFGEAERIIARQQLATKIALGTATIPEIKAWNALISQEKKTDDEKKKDDLKKQLEEEAELRERFAQAAFEGMQERNARDLQINADKLTELDRQASFQRELALKGEVNTLQEVEKARAEALAEKASMEKKAANLAKGEKAAEIFLEFYKAYANEKEGAFMKALTATAKGKGGEAAVKALFSGSFYDGTEDTGKGGDLDAKGGFGAVIHPHERILTRAHNDAIGDISNEEVVRRVNLFEDMPVADKRIDVQVNESLNRALHSELKRIAKAVENPAYIDIQRNYINELVSIERRLGAQIETTHKRIGSSYSRD